ncbi:MAG TPA: flagellar biosynthetic protein FliO [Spirochaetia bacterium]|nr:flagellar biosynthetic protein FliO [Spirochaetia bacterium]
MRILACVIATLAITAMPVLGQANTSSAAGSPATGVSGAQTNLNESELVIPGSGGAQNAPAVQNGSPGVSAWDFVRMLIVLALVVAAIYLLFWVLRRGTRKKITENDLIHVLGSRSLAGNRALHLVEVGSSVFLVGASDGGVQLISQITEKESLDAVRLKAAEEGPAGRRTFQQVLSEIFRPADHPVSLRDGVGFLRDQQDKLRKL